jgi:4-diphosphocytidyl-2-C-methyl-D-erythritol kinase
MQIERDCPCKVNFILNILGRRADGFHELETLLYPIQYCDRIGVRRSGSGIELSCNDPALPTDSTNLVHRAATAFKEATGIQDGLMIHLEKRIPVAAGLGGGSGNAAVTLLLLNELFGHPLSDENLTALAARLGSDIPFFLQNKPALGLGRGEKILPLTEFQSLKGMHILLLHPGFGISTPWAYKKLASFPAALNGTPGRARALADFLGALSPEETVGSGTQAEGWRNAQPLFYNSLEAPALHKYPILRIYQEYFMEHGALVSLMSGSGSTTFAIFASAARATNALEQFYGQYGTAGWVAVVPL